MKKIALLTSLVLGFSLNTTTVKADVSQEEKLGFVSGALTGAALGGPVGFFIGAVSGVILGNQVEKANQLELVNNELSSQQFENEQLHIKINTLTREYVQVDLEQQSETIALAQNLSVNLIFNTNSSKLSNEDTKTVIQLAKVLHQHPNLKLRLEGHADPRGTKEDNLKLSQERTSSVAQAFATQGITIGRIISESFGESQATVSFDNLDTYAVNRRVSIRFLTPKMPTIAKN